MPFASEFSRKNTRKERLSRVLGILETQCVNDDTEMAHGVADEAIVKALVVLKTGHTQDMKDLIDRIIDTYEKVGKWYA
jgi:hypothetical protein